MAPRWIGFLVFIFVIGILVGSVAEGINLAEGEQVTTLNSMMSWSRITSEEDFGMIEFVGSIPQYFEGLFKTITMDFPIWPDNSPWELVRWVFWAPIIAVIVFGLVIIFFAIFQRTV